MKGLKTGRILIFFFFLSALFFLGEKKAHASPYNYASIGETLDSKVVIGYDSLDEPIYFVCDSGALLCESAGSTIPTLTKLDAGTEEKNHFWNPQKTKLFVSDIAAGGVVQNAIYKVAGGVATLESILPTHERVFRAIFSSDGTRLILITREGNLVSVNTQTKAVVFKKPFVDKPSASSLTLSPNGKFLAYYIPAYASTHLRTIKLWSLAENKLFETKDTVEYWDLLSENLKIFEFAPDSAKLVYLDDRDNFPTLYSVNLKNPNSISMSGERILTKPYTVSDFIFSDSSTIYFVANRESPLTWSLYRFDLVSSSLTHVRDDISYAQTIRKFENALLYLHIGENGAEPEIVNTQSGKVSPLTTLRASGTQADAGKDEIAAIGGLYGVLMKPAGFKSTESYPLLIWLHGGPYRQTSVGFHSYVSYAGYDAILEEVRAMGAVVLKLDYTGSYGYGRDFAEKIKGRVGVADVADVANAISFVKKTVNIDGVYTMGNSYGGYLALRAVVDNPKAYAGAISINGVTDWEILLTQLRDSIFNVYFDGVPDATNRSLYDRASILTRLKNISGQKFLLINGENDTTIPPIQSDVLYGALKEYSVDAQIVKYPGEDHIIRERESLEDICKKTLGMMELKLGRSACSFK
ncbi:MAG: prolyl oligopeptidase family serine peptidase [Candidatus Taylorbacteria bacterium]